MARAFAVWIGMMLLAIANGAFRDLLIFRMTGPVAGRAVSSIILCALIMIVALRTIEWIGPSSKAQAFGIGVFWLTLTLAFEFLAGHYVFGTPWATILADYDVSRGRIWLLVPLVTLLAPIYSLGRHSHAK
jgi:hypothetical protein